MRFSIAFVTSALAALATAQSAPNPFNIPTGGLSMSVGVPTTLSWAPTTEGTISLYLRDGPNANLNPGIALVSGIPNTGTFVYTPTAANSNTGTAYTIEIVSDADPGLVNFTPRFYINTGSATSTSAAAADPTDASNAMVKKSFEA
ncbi:hypothetical protein MMC16_002553 [Acarospora aff. strigata]|nr:hypothetical protein [Acarospora aff. strigata]